MQDLNNYLAATAYGQSPWDLRSANNINDTGQIVGWGYHGSAPHAFLMTPQ